MWLASIQAFVISPTLHLYGSISSLSYGPSRQDDINEEEKDTVYPLNNDFQKQLNEQLVDPACDIDDDECIEFSLALNSNINEVSFIPRRLFVATYNICTYDMLTSLFRIHYVMPKM